MNKSHYLSAFLSVFALVKTSSSLQAQFIYDLGQPAPASLGSALIDGAYLFSVTPTTASGTGVFDTFLRIQGPNGGTQAGYNSGASNLMPDVKSGQTGELLRSDLGIMEFAGLQYYSFGLDINETSGQGREYLSLDKLQIWVRSTDLADASSFALLEGSGAIKVWDMDLGVNGDSTILLDSELSGSGSGRANVSFLLPTTLIDTGTDSTWRIILYTEMGFTGILNGIDYQAHGGFEEWGTFNGGDLILLPPAAIPEASTWAAMFGMTGAVGLTFWRRARRQPVVVTLN